MGTRHFCDICDKDLPSSNYDVYKLELHPLLGIRNIDSGQIGLNMEICKDCANDVRMYVHYIKKIEEKNNG